MGRKVAPVIYMHNSVSVAYMGKVRMVMNIDKTKLKLGIWYEDENGNVINQKED